MKYNNIFFDLDGTLTDSGEGIRNSVSYALDKFGIKDVDKAVLNKFIGPPLIDAFIEHFGFTHENAELALKYYREYFAPKGIYENSVYEGIPELLGDLRLAGAKLYLATSKPEHFAKQILDHFDLAKYFAYVSGPEMDGTRNEKHEVIEYALQNLNIPSADVVLMVGDRRDDVVGAQKCNMNCVGVEWGFGTKEELVAAGAIQVIQEPQELLNFFEE